MSAEDRVWLFLILVAIGAVCILVLELAIRCLFWLFDHLNYDQATKKWSWIKGGRP